jgi:hypothetical protein
MRDTSPDAATPALGYAANMISVCVLIFLSLVAFIFWLGGLAERAGHKAPVSRSHAVVLPAGAPLTVPETARVQGD